MEIIKMLAVPFAIIAMTALVYYWAMFIISVCSRNLKTRV
jgi:hypothetical protein